MQQYKFDTGFESDPTDTDPAWVFQSRKIIVDPSISFEKSVREGSYDLVGNRHIGPGGIDEDHFPLNFQKDARYQAEAELVTYDFSKPEMARKQFSRPGYRFGSPGEMLAYGAQYPDVQRHVSIESLFFGQSLMGSRFALRLDGSPGTQKLPGTRRLGCLWTGKHRGPLETFLIVRDISFMV